MDRTGWIIVIACALGLFWWWDGAQKFAAQERERLAAEELAAEDGGGGDDTPVADGEGGGETGDAPPADPEVESVERVEATLSTEKVDWIFSNAGAGIQRAVLKEHELQHEDDAPAEAGASDWKVELNRYAEMPIGTLSRGNGEFEELVYDLVSEEAGMIQFRATDTNGLEITKTYTLTGADDPGRGYLVKLDLGFRYTGESGNYAAERYFVYNGAAAPLFPGEASHNVGFDYMRKGKDAFRAVTYFKKESRAKWGEECERLLWTSAVNQFFTVNICAETESEGELPVWASRFPVELTGYAPEASEGLYAVHGAIGIPGFTLNPGEARNFKFEIYAGPKHYPTLRGLDRDRDEVMGFDRIPLLGWMAEPFSKLLSSLMNWLHSMLGNFGWAIVLITVIIRLVIWPLHIKSQRTMKRMALLQPKMQELRDKYKDNPQRMNQEMMALYRDYGANPMSGCFPVLLQMPIFFGFFSMLRSASELRHEPWLAWVKDLSMPDTVFHILGFPVNILPLLMAVTMVLQMKMTPSTGDKMQRRIFMIMPLIFLVFCYNFASALALYWTAQNIISMGQTWLLRNQQEVKLVKRERPARTAPSRKGGGASFGAPPQKKAPKRPQKRTGGGSAKRK